MVKDVLLDQTDSIEIIVYSLLIIVYRLRNNLFHGEKWVYKLGDQVANFQIANRILQKFLDLIPIDKRFQKE